MSSLAWHEVVYSASSLYHVLFGVSLSFSLHHACALVPWSFHCANVTTRSSGIVCWFSQLPKGGTGKPHYASMSLVLCRDVYARGLCCCPHTFWTGSPPVGWFFATSRHQIILQVAKKHFLFFTKQRPHWIRSNVWANQIQNSDFFYKNNIPICNHANVVR